MRNVLRWRSRLWSILACSSMSIVCALYPSRARSSASPIFTFSSTLIGCMTHTWAPGGSSCHGLTRRRFFGCRPCSLFDTRVKLNDPNDSQEPITNVPVTSAPRARKGSSDVRIQQGTEKRRNRVDHTVTTIDYDSDFSAIDESISDFKSDSHSDFSSTCSYDEDSDTDDDCNAGSEETRSFLCRHFIIFIVANPISGKLSLVFLKATLLHTPKGKTISRACKQTGFGTHDHLKLI